MDITLLPGKLAGAISIPASKSMAHRMLICAAFSDTTTHLVCPQVSEDIEATAEALAQLCPSVRKIDDGYLVQPYTRSHVIQAPLQIHCRESGSTLRFLLPIVGALGIETQFVLDGRLPQRPLSPLWEEMQRMGCHLTRPTERTILCQGKLRSGAYRMDGSVSSQFISGLMMALPLIEGKTSLEITGNVQSKPYIEMTRQVLRFFSEKHPQQVAVEGDWSNAAFWLAANALGSSIDLHGLNHASPQGDQTVRDLLPRLEENCEISAADIPDLIPILAVVAAAKHGAVFTHIQRLRLKESDRVASTIAMLQALGGKAEATEDTLIVYGTGLYGGTVDSFADHRIAMAAAIAATVCHQPVQILGGECVKKSYPEFWDAYAQLGGKYEKQLR